MGRLFGDNEGRPARGLESAQLKESDYKFGTSGGVLGTLLPSIEMLLVLR